MPPRQPQVPRVVELLLDAHEWRRQLDTGEVRTRAEIARREGITRARVTQIMSLLRLAPETQDHILSLPESTQRPALTERSIRKIVRIPDEGQQMKEFQAPRTDLRPEATSASRGHG